MTESQERTSAILRGEDIVVEFPVGGRILSAVRGASIHVDQGETLALIGESGSGKTTLGRALLLEQRPTSGRVEFRGVDVTDATGTDLRDLRRNAQMVWQDPYSSLNPRLTVERIIAEPLMAHRWGDRDAIRARVAELLIAVGLDPEVARRRPRAFSGGQRQRIAIARALAVEPDVVVADEPVSSLDVSVQAQIAALLADLQQRMGQSYLVIAHDVALVSQLADRVVVMYLGSVVESGPSDVVLGEPAHPYTAALVSAHFDVEDPHRPRIVLGADMPDPLSPPSGCPFVTRCPIARPHCASDRPPLEPFGSEGRSAACWYPGELETHVDVIHQTI